MGKNKGVVATTNAYQNPTDVNYGYGITQGSAQEEQGFNRAGATGDQQSQLAQALMQQASGQGPSLAQAQLQQATDQNARMAAGAIASQRGLNPAQAARLTLQNQAAANQQAAGQAGMLRMQEQMSAREQLGNVLGQQRQGDLGMSSAGTSMFGTAGQLRGAQNQLQYQTAEQNAQRAYDANVQNAQINAAKSAATKQMIGGMVGGLLGGAGTALSGGLLGGKKTPGGASGGVVAGRADHDGDNPDNDTVPAMLSPGEIVIPRTVAQAKDAPERAAEFVALIKKQKQPRESGGEYGEIVRMQRDNADRLARLERMFLGGTVVGAYGGAP